MALLATGLARVHRAWASSTALSRSRPGSAPSLTQIEVSVEREWPHTRGDLDAETQAAKLFQEPLPPPARDPGRLGADETEDANRLINPLRGRRREGEVEHVTGVEALFRACAR